jgi:hypothetical protein
LKNQRYRNTKTGSIITAYDRGLAVLKREWQEQKDMGVIGEDSSDFDHFIEPDREDVIEFGIQNIEAENYWDVEEGLEPTWERIK